MNGDRPGAALLWGAVLMPLVYFGIQAALAPLTPGYSPVRDVASLLGMAGAPYAAWFNAAAIASGVCALLGAAGLLPALAGGAPLWLRILVPLAVALMGLGNIWAGAFALPDPRHGNNPFALAFFLMPPLLCLAAWWANALRGLRVYLTLNLSLFIAMVPVMAGFAGIDRAVYGGLLQRVLALWMFVPVGVVGWHLIRNPPGRARG